MKRFLLNFVLFLLILSAYFALVFAFNSFFIKKYPPKIKGITLILGDSHLMTAATPEILENTTNVCQAAEPYFISYHKLKTFLQHNPQIVEVVLGFSYHNIAQFNDEKLLSEEWDSYFFDLTYPIISWKKWYWHQQAYIIKQKNVFPPVNFTTTTYSYFKNYFLFPKINHKKYIGHFVKRPFALGKNDVEKTINKHYFFNKKQGISQSSIYWLKEIIQLCKNQGIKITLVAPPLHPFYEKKVPDFIKNEYRQLLQDFNTHQKHFAQNKSPLNFINLTKLDYPDSLFFDYDHLNYEGALIFSEQLKTELKKH